MKQLVHRPDIDGARCTLCDCLGTAKFVTWVQALRAVIACSLTQLKHLFCLFCMMPLLFYPGMPGDQFVAPQQQPAEPLYGGPAAGGYASYAPPPSAVESLACFLHTLR